jgi:heme/copper-type cytochrome/quinol oxidase subunit 3
VDVPPPVAAALPVGTGGRQCAPGFLFLVLHAIHLGRLEFSPQTNAYGSIFFVLNWAMDLLVVLGLGVAGTALIRVWKKDEHWQLFQALHVQMAAHYGYFAAAVAAAVYGALYLSPHWI